jgi:RNA polymerase sigma-70 factor (ECF subfamily)
MPLGHLSDEELAQTYQFSIDSAERDSCVNELFRRNYAKVARWCLRFTADRETAADLSQEIFAKAYQNLSLFQGQSKFSTWLFIIARNHCLNAVRSNARQATELKGETDDDFLSEIQDWRASPYDVVESQFSAKMVSDLLNEGLDETEKVVFMLHYGEDVPLNTISRMLQLENRSGAKAYIVSAKRKLGRLVQQRTARHK